MEHSTPFPIVLTEKHFESDTKTNPPLQMLQTNILEVFLVEYK